MGSEKPFIQLVVESDELAATKQPLDHADGLLGEVRFLDRDSRVLTAVLATGVEKLLKLTYGLTRAHIDDQWPADDIRGFSHRVSDLDAGCRRLLLERESFATNPGVVSAARSHVDGDPWLPAILRILQRYGVNGRFFNLDYLGQRPHVEPSPRTLWQELDHETWAADPNGLATDAATFDANERRRAQAWQTSIRRWRWLYYQCWVQNMCGPEARRYAHEIRGPEPRT